jgi:hypothetical protein
MGGDVRSREESVQPRRRRCRFIGSAACSVQPCFFAAVRPRGCGVIKCCPGPAPASLRRARGCERLALEGPPLHRVRGWAHGATAD